MRRGPSALNALIAIDKPAGMTSHDVVARVRRCVGERRVGHAGTLDPDATGVLVVGIGQATKLLGLLTLDRKGYRSSFVLGSSTTTDDASGEGLATAEVDPALLAEDAARRELDEELGVHVGVAWPYDEVTHDYGETRVHMTLVVCPLAPGEEPVADPAVHDALRWLSREELLDVEWVAADEPVARSLGTFWDATFDPVHL